MWLLVGFMPLSDSAGLAFLLSGQCSAEFGLFASHLFQTRLLTSLVWLSR